MQNLEGYNTTGRRMTDKISWKLLGYLLNVLLVVLIGLSAWAGKQLFAFEAQLSSVSSSQERSLLAIAGIQEAQRDLTTEIVGLKEWRAEATASRFTASDGREVWREIAAIRESIASMALVEPPTWLIDRINTMEQRLQNLEERVTR